MARIRIEDLPTIENLTQQELEEIFGAGLRSFKPTLEGLEAREMMDVGLRQVLLPQASQLRRLATPQAQPMQVDFGQFNQPARADVNRTYSSVAKATMPTASLKDPLADYHRRYVEAKDLRKGDFLLNTTEHWISNTIKVFSNSNYNHAALYVGDGKVVEAVGDGVRHISLQAFLKDGHLERSMVIRHEQLRDEQRDAIAKFAIKQVGKPYNLVGVLDSGTKLRDLNRFDRANYYCSQLVAASYASAGVPLHPYSLDFSPGELADLVSSHKLTVVGAVFDLDFHHAVRDGRESISPDRLALLQHDAETVRSEAHRLLANRLKNAGFTEGYSGITRSWVNVSANNIEVKFQIKYYVSSYHVNKMYPPETTTGTITINFSPRLNGTERLTGSRVEYLAHSPSMHDLHKGKLNIGRIERAVNEFVANDHIQGSHLYDPSANKIAHEWDVYREKLSNYIKERVGADLKTHTASVVDMHDGIILNGHFETKEGQSVWFEFRMKFVGFADGQGQYVCIRTRERAGSIARWNMSGDHFNTTKQASELMIPAELAKQVFNDTKRVLSGHGFTAFRLPVHEYMSFGLRVRIQAQGADGRWQNFDLDVKAEGQRVYSCVRATNEFDSVTPGDQHNRLLGALIKGVRNSAT